MAHRSYRATNLQNRSFRGQTLVGVDFSKANLRGCTFQGANLQGANLQGAILGRSRWQWLQLGLAIGLTVILMGHSLTRLIFAALGEPLGGTSGMLVIVLHTVLMATGVGQWLKGRSPRVAFGLSSALCGAVLGFFYGGNSFGEALLPAGIGAVLGAVGGYGVSHRPSPGWRIALIVANLATTSGTVFLLGTTAIAAVASHHWLGMIFTGLTLLYLWVSWGWSQDLAGQVSTFGGTSFRDADLSQANFSGVHPGQSCFDGAILDRAIAPPTNPANRDNADYDGVEPSL